MSENMTDSLVKEIKGRVREKIEQGNIDGDIAWWTLTIVSDVHDKQVVANERLECVEKNPAIRAGNLFKKSPLIAWAISQIVTIVLVATSLAVLIGLLDSLGLALVIKP